jgi:hypothetical protein
MGHGGATALGRQRRGRVSRLVRAASPLGRGDCRRVSRLVTSGVIRHWSRVKGYSPCTLPHCPFPKLEIFRGEIATAIAIAFGTQQL